MTIRLTRSRRRTFALLWLCAPACGNGVSADSTTDAPTTGSPTSFLLTDPGDDTPTTGEPTPQTSTETGHATTSGEAGTTTHAAACGDSVVDPGETCDDGPANDPAAVCTDACQLNVCGDGKVLADVEQCDDAAANVDTGPCRSDCKLGVCGDGFVLTGVEQCDSAEFNGPAYGGCDESCTINRCGDGELDPAEQCDDGELNGTGRPGDQGSVACGGDCGFAGLRLFVSSKLFTGDMGSRAGADLACQLMAEAAVIPHAAKFKAVLADSLGSPNTFLADNPSKLPFIAPGGLVLAVDYPALIAEGPGPGVLTTETGDTLTEVLVWTNVGPFGDAFLVDPAHTCVDWTSASDSKWARVGINAVGPDNFSQWQAERQWLTFANQQCNEEYRIYCIETP